MKRDYHARTQKLQILRPRLGQKVASRAPEGGRPNIPATGLSRASRGPKPPTHGSHLVSCRPHKRERQPASPPDRWPPVQVRGAPCEKTIHAAELLKSPFANWRKGGRTHAAAHPISPRASKPARHGQRVATSEGKPRRRNSLHPYKSAGFSNHGCPEGRGVIHRPMPPWYVLP